MKKLIAMLFALALTCSTVAFAQDKPADDKKMDKMEDKKEKKHHKKHKKEKMEKMEKTEAPK
jgi:hypothetical protein